MLLMSILAFARFDGQDVCLDIHRHINTALRVLGSFCVWAQRLRKVTALTLHDSRVTPDRSAEPQPPFPTLFSRVWENPPTQMKLGGLA